MKLRYLSEPFYDELLENYEKNIRLYMSKEPFIYDYFESKQFYNETNILIGEINLDYMKNGKPDDFLCAISLYTALVNLTPFQASNAFLWSYLSHTVGWNYLQKRWPIDEENTSRIKSRYFVSSFNNRTNIFRNGLSRLWWGVYISIDDNDANKYKYTQLLFSDQDLFVSLVERDFSMCREVSLGILKYLYEKKEELGDLLHIDIRRDLMKYINRIGGVQSLDLLNRNEIYELCDNYVQKKYNK